MLVIKDMSTFLGLSKNMPAGHWTNYQATLDLFCPQSKCLSPRACQLSYVLVYICVERPLTWNIDNIRFFLFSLKMLVIKDLSTFPGFCMFMVESHWGELLSNIKGIVFLYHFQSNWWRLPAVGRQPGYLVHHEGVTICQSVWSWGENFEKQKDILTSGE